MNDHPLGIVTNDSGEPIATPNIGEPDAKSIVDTVFTLDAYLSSDVRRAEKTARFCVDPGIEAQMEDLNAELETLVGPDGRPKSSVDASMADGGRSALVVSQEIEALEAKYAAAMANVRLKAMDEDDWTAFMARNKAALDGAPPFPAALYEDLILNSEPTVTMPGGKAEPISREQLSGLRKALGHAAFNEISQKAWEVNTSSGVSVPKSSLSSAVLRHIEQG
jgi:hypothetical protein